MGVEEKGELRSEIVHLEPSCERRLNIGDGVGECESDLLDGRRTCLTNVITGDGDRIPIWDVLLAVSKDVRD